MHFYNQDGESRHTIVSKNGKERNSTLADAKRHSWYPSVTTIMSVAASPGLTEWKIDQAIIAALQNPYAVHYKIRQIAEQTGKDAAEEGNRIHDLMENVCNTGELPADRIVCDAWCELNEKFGEVTWIAEASLVHGGYAGRVDLHSKDGEGIVVDFKTKAKDDLSRVKGYDNHLMQLAAYREGLAIPKARCYNMFISTTNPGEVKFIEWSEEDLQRGYKMFTALRDFFYLMNKWER